MKIELEIKGLSDEVLVQVAAEINADNTLTPNQRLLDWLEARITTGFEDLFEDASVDEDIDIPQVLAKEVK